MCPQAWRPDGWDGMCHRICTMKHVLHLRHFRRVHRDRLVKRRGTTKHVTHISHFRRVHRNRLVKRRGTIKHAPHISHFRCVPLINRFVKLLHVPEQIRHVRHKRDVPSVGFAVILYATVALLDPLFQLLFPPWLEFVGSKVVGGSILRRIRGRRGE